MSTSKQSIFSQSYGQAISACRDGFRVVRQRGPSQIQFWFIALVIGIGAGFAALFFRKGINSLQSFLYGTDDVQHLHSFAQSLPWYLILTIPIVGGLVVGVILHLFTRDGRARSVAEVIEGAAMREGRVETRAGLASALASFITLSSGGSTGREGPVVHLAAVISTKVCLLRSRRMVSRVATCWAVRWRRLYRPVSTRRSRGRCSRWKSCCATLPCMPLRPS